MKRELLPNGKKMGKVVGNEELEGGLEVDQSMNHTMICRTPLRIFTLLPKDKFSIIRSSPPKLSTEEQMRTKKFFMYLESYG